MIKKIANVLGWVVVVFLFCYGIYGGWQMTKTLWPGLHDDGVLYSTVAINRANGLGNHFDVHTRSLIRSGGATEFKGHGQLYYPVAAALLSTPDYEGFLGFVHWSNLVAYLLAFVVFCWQAHRSLRTGCLLSSMLGVAGAYSIMAVLHYLQGRPEHGIPFILLLFQLAVLLFRWPSLPAPLAGLQVGLVGAVSPLPGAILGLGSAVALVLCIPNSNGFLKKFFQIILFAVLGWALASFLAYPGNILELITNSLGGAGMYLFHPHEISMFWVRLNLAPGLGLMFAAGVFAMCALTARILKCPGRGFQKLILFTAIFLLGYLVWVHGVSWAATNYCFLPFFPAIAWWLLDFGRFSNTGSRHMPLAVLVASGLVVFAGMALPGFGALRTMLLQNPILEKGVSYQTARTEIDETKKLLNPGEVVGIRAWTAARSAVVFDAPPWHFRTVFFPFFTSEKKIGAKSKFFLVLQFTHANPQKVAGFKLVKNRFQTEPVYFMGIRLKSSTPGYGYALYERDEAALETLSRDPESADDFK